MNCLNINIIYTMLFRIVKKIIILSILLIPAQHVSDPAVARANNLQISSAVITQQNSKQLSANIRFDLSWDNSWKNPYNHDAVWVFAKYSTDQGLTWNHASLKASGINPAGYSVGQGTQIETEVSADHVGAFVRRSVRGGGAVSVQSFEMVWDYGAQGLTAGDRAMVKVFGIEMVYVPSGSFYAGDGAVSQAAFKQGHSDSDPWSILSSSSISVNGSAANGFYYQSAGNSGEDQSGDSFTIPAAFPNGFGAFYAMKHEVTEGLWSEFFNTLTAEQKMARDITSPFGKNSDGMVQRNTFSWGQGASGTARADRACGYLSWMDGVAFADWAGLRPMTELEFEKLCRGAGVAVVEGEYAWGTADAGSPAQSLSGSEDGTETILETDARAAYGSQVYSSGDGGSGPVRAGIFATPTSTRLQAGSGFYGVLELSGNLADRVVTVGNAQGRVFRGSHGDGQLADLENYEGNATNEDWPGIDSLAARGVTGAEGSGLRGGSWLDSTDRLKTSDRSAAAAVDSSRSAQFGFRAVRTAS